VAQAVNDRTNPRRTEPFAGQLEQAPFSIVCLSQSRWDAELPTNRQQIMRRAAQRGHHVFFVDTASFLGKRVAEVIRRRSPAAALLDVIRPSARGNRVYTMTAFNALPWGHRYRLCNAVNNWLSGFFVRRAARSLPAPVALWVYDPCAASLIGRCGESVAAYDCVDDYTAIAFYGPHERALARYGDRRAAASSDVVFTTTSTLYERHRELNPRTHLVGNVGDYAHFEGAVDREKAPEALRALPRPVIGFAGNIVPGKVDIDLVEFVAAKLEEGSLLLAGPAEWDMKARIERLTQRENVVWLGQIPYDELPAVLSSFDVALIPYVENAYTRSCFPLKLFEYLAAGKPVVASGLPELGGMEPDVVVASGMTAFVGAIERALSSRSESDVERRRQIARMNTWETRTETLVQLVQERFPRNELTVSKERERRNR